MSIFDGFTLGVLLISGIWAYSRGFVRETLSIGAWVVAVIATLYLTPIAEPYVEQHIQSFLVAAIVTGIGLFILTLIAASMLTSAVSKTVQDSALGALDSALGFLFGLARGAVVVILIWMAYAWLVPPEKREPWIMDARVQPWVETGADIGYVVLPDYVRPNHPPAEGGAQATQPTQDQQLYNDAITPKTEAPQGANPADGYGTRERNELDRLFDLTQ